MVDKVLIVEDEQDISALVAINVEELNLTSEQASTGEMAMELVKTNHYALVILDVMLPGVSGLDVCRQIRELKPEQAIMMLTSRDSETDRVVGLELGADDYMAKPFSVRELQARVRSLLRRVRLLSQLQSQTKDEDLEHYINVGQLNIDHLSHKVTLSGETLDLTSTEYDLLYYLASHPDQVFSRSQLLNSVWGYHHSGYEHTVNSHINRLRNKLERNVTQPEIVQTVWGVGYKFNPQGVAA